MAKKDEGEIIIRGGDKGEPQSAQVHQPPRSEPQSAQMAPKAPPREEPTSAQVASRPQAPQDDMVVVTPLRTVENMRYGAGVFTFLRGARTKVPSSMLPHLRRCNIIG